MVRRLLNTGNGGWLPTVLASPWPPVVLAWIWKCHYVISRLRRVPKFVAPQDLVPQYIEPHTLNPAGGMGKRKIDHLIS